MKRKISYLWVIPSILLFPALQLLIFFFRFNYIPYELLGQSFVFAPIGFISVTALIYFLRKEEDEGRRKKIVLCFALAVPIGWFHSLIGGQFSVSPVFIAFFGTMPLLIGILIGRKKKSLWKSTAVIVIALLVTYSSPMIVMKINPPEDSSHSAANTLHWGDYDYTVSHTDAIITGYTGSGGEVTIPAVIASSSGKYAVTAIGNGAFMMYSSLTKVTIPASVTSIGNGAFASCTNLTEIKIPDSVTTIGNSAFRDCGNLTEVTIGENVTFIDSGAFQGCKKLNVITIYSASAPAVGADIFKGVPSGAVLNIQQGSVGYDVKPWSDFEQHILQSD